MLTKLNGILTNRRCSMRKHVSPLDDIELTDEEENWEDEEYLD